MDNRRAPARELTIELGEADELFRPRQSNVAFGIPSQESGIDQIRNELSAGPRRGPLTAVIVLENVGRHDDVGIRTAVDRYCDHGIRQAENELKAIRREGTRALVVGSLILAVFLALSEVILQTGLPKGIRTFFGDGLFLVAAWVGMWYPLDTLIYTGRPYRIERGLLRAIRAMRIVVRPAGSDQRP